MFLAPPILAMGLVWLLTAPSWVETATHVSPNPVDEARKIRDSAGVFQLELTDPDMRHGELDFAMGGFQARGVWVDFPAGRDASGARQRFRQRWFWIDEEAVRARYGEEAGAPLALVQGDVEASLVKHQGSQKPVVSWLKGLGVPAEHDAKLFRSPGPATWMREVVGGTAWEQFRGMQRGGGGPKAPKPLLGYVGVRRENGRIFVNTLWWDAGVLTQKPQALARYGRLAEATAKSFRLLAATE